MPASLLHRPRGTALWRLSFQLHLWIGLLLTLYIVVLGVSGSLLVFRTELEQWTGVRPRVGAPVVVNAETVEAALVAVRMKYPRHRILAIQVPTKEQPNYITTVQGLGKRVRLESDGRSAQLLGPVQRQRSWIEWTADLHATWLAGPRGRIANGAGAALLLLVNITGMVIWWPGVKTWRRGLTIDRRRRWRRITFDAHRAIGFWTLLVVSIWAVTGIYFGWPAEVRAAVTAISPARSSLPPSVIVRPVGPARSLGVRELLAAAQQREPEAALVSLQFPYSRRAPYEVILQRPGGSGRDYQDTLYFSGWNGSFLKAWRYGVNETWGDWFLWLQVPLHFGTRWGTAFKVLWCLLGLAFPVLAITGVLLYWNRVLRHLRR